jgi:hypothetical protein
MPLQVVHEGWQGAQTRFCSVVQLLMPTWPAGHAVQAAHTRLEVGVGACVW